MKFNRNISFIALAIGTAFASSCLKDSKPNLDAGAGNNVVAFLDNSVPINYSGTGGPVYDNGITLVGDTGGLNMNINWAGPQASAPTDITVNLKVDSDYLVAYNALNNTDYALPPKDVYSLPSSVVIKAGTSKTITRLTMTAAADYSYDSSYALPVTITSVSYGTASTNYGSAIYSFILNNKYTDTYTLTGYFFRSGSGSRSISTTYYLPTTGVSSNQFPVGDLGTSSSQFWFNATTPAAGGAMTGYAAMGATYPAPASGFLTTANPGGADYSNAAPNVPGSGSWTTATYNNSYDATNMIYWFHVGYGSGAVSPSGYNRETFFELAAQ